MVRRLVSRAAGDHFSKQELSSMSFWLEMLLWFFVTLMSNFG